MQNKITIKIKIYKIKIQSKIKAKNKLLYTLCKHLYILQMQCLHIPPHP